MTARSSAICDGAGVGVVGGPEKPMMPEAALVLQKFRKIHFMGLCG
jgi:hypothetical protein